MCDNGEDYKDIHIKVEAYIENHIKVWQYRGLQRQSHQSVNMERLTKTTTSTCDNVADYKDNHIKVWPWRSLQRQQYQSLWPFRWLHQNIKSYVCFSTFTYLTFLQNSDIFTYVMIEFISIFHIGESKLNTSFKIG